MGFLTLSLDSEVAVRLADEGVPLRVIARATRIPPDTLRDTLTDAKTAGRLLTLPQDDWATRTVKGSGTKSPVKLEGSQGASQEAQFARVQQDDAPKFLFTIQRLFKITPLEADLLITLIQRSMVPKEYPKLEVHICHLRQRLKPFKLKIVTVWGYGYQLSLDDRCKAMGLILRRISSLPA